MRHLARLFVRHAPGDGGDVFGRVAAATAGEIEQAGVGELGHEFLHVPRFEIEAGGCQRIGKPGVRIAGNVGGGAGGELLQMGTHESGPERAIETNRERVEHQTSETACMNCHSLINPLGFSLENFDAAGRFRTEEKEKPIDVTGVYQTPSGEAVKLTGPRDLATFLAGNEMAQKSFISQLFNHYAKQSIYAYGDDPLEQLYAKFVGSQYSMRQLLFEIASTTCLPSVEKNEDAKPTSLSSNSSSGQ